MKRFEKSWILNYRSWIHDARNLLKDMVKSWIPF